MRISIIIPAYNCQDYIEETIRSALDRLPNDCEVILVDDGSDDHTKDRLFEFEKDGRVRIVLRPHRGASAARNAGLDAAKGDYVAFLDCDDRYCEGFFEHAIDQIGTADLYIFGIERVFLSGEQEDWELKDRVYEDASVFADDYIVNRHLLIYSNSNKLYRRRVIKDHAIRFDETLSFGEDRLFNYRFLSFCGAVVTSHLHMFRYLERKESLSTRHVPDLFALSTRLHDEKMRCFLSLSRRTTAEERADFVAYDLAKEIEKTVDRFGAHPEEIKENLPAIQKLIFGEEDASPSGVDILIVMGSTNCGYRIEKAYEIGSGLTGVTYLVSGGNPYRDGKRTEAQFMADYLREKGVPEEQILMEDLACTTEENLKEGAAIVKKIRAVQRALPGDGQKKKTGIVCAGFHLGRVRLLAERTADFSEEELIFFPAYGPRTAPDVWYKDPAGRAIVLNEFQKRIRLSELTDERIDN